LLDIGQQIDHHLPTALHHPKDGWPFLLQGPSASFALEPTSTSLSALALHHLRLAFMTRNHIGFCDFNDILAKLLRHILAVPSRPALLSATIPTSAFIHNLAGSTPERA
jgi:hypothetical protein